MYFYMTKTYFEKRMDSYYQLSNQLKREILVDISILICVFIEIRYFHEFFKHEVKVYLFWKNKKSSPVTYEKFTNARRKKGLSFNKILNFLKVNVSSVFFQLKKFIYLKIQKSHAYMLHVLVSPSHHGLLFFSLISLQEQKCL